MNREPARPGTAVLHGNLVPAGDGPPSAGQPVPVPAGTSVVAVVRGTVVHGNAWGRVIGFPTANVVTPDLAASAGIWAADASGPGLPPRGAPAAVSIGTRPTYYGEQGELLLEAHVLDFQGDLYGATITVRLFEFLRPEVRFTGTAALMAQLVRDVETCRRWHARVTAPGR